MRLLAYLALTVCAYGQAVYRLDVGAESFSITDAGTTMYVPTPLRGANRIVFTLWNERFKKRGPGSITDCANPCSIALDRATYGSWYAYLEALDASGVRVSDNLQFIDQRLVTETSFTMPLEVLGGAPMSRKVQVTTQANSSAAGTIRLWARTHRVGYEGKARVRVNDGTYLEVKKSNVTFLRDAANWTFPTMDFSVSTLEWTMPIADPNVGSANTVEWQFWQQKDAATGYRVLEFSFLQPDVSVASVVVSGTTVTVTTTDPHNLVTGDDALMINYPGKAWRVNGMKRNITVTGATTFTFTISESDGRLAETTSYPGVSVAKSMLDMDQFTQDDPSTWTAPAGGNAATGDTLASLQDSLIDIGYPGYAIKAACTSCHFQDLGDMELFAYSNRSIIQRSMFHGLTEQQGKDIAAYVRGNAYGRPGRPWNPPYQPCPNADVIDVRDWPFGCTIDDVLPYDTGMYEGLFGSSIGVEDFIPTLTDSRHWRNQRISFPLQDWNDWLPVNHPMDIWKTNPGTNGYPYWPNSKFLLAYNELRSGLTGKCPTPTCAAENSGRWTGGPAEYYASRWADIGGREFTRWAAGGSSPLGPCVGGVPNDFSCPGVYTTVSNQLARYGYDAALLGFVKFFEITYEFDLARYGSSNYYTDSGTARVVPYGGAFNLSPNLLQILKTNGIPGIRDGLPATEKLISMQTYQIAAIINPNTDRFAFDTINPLDVGYTQGYFKDLYYTANMRLPYLTTQWVQQNIVRLINREPDATNSPTSWRGLDLVNVGMLVNPDYTPLYAVIPESERTATINALVDAAMTGFWNLVGGLTANGTAGTFTTADWIYWANDPMNNINLGIAPCTSLGRCMWASLIYGKPLGLSSTTLDNIANTYGPNIIGARNWSTARSFTGCVWNATTLKVEASGGGNCDGVAPNP